MALQSSGQIKISEIKAELGSSSNSLNTLSVAAGKTAPHAMSEFYGYASYTNSHYYSNDGTNDYITGEKTGNTPFDINTTQDLSFNFWVRIKSTSKNNETLWNFGSTTANGNNRIFMQYIASSNRLLCRVRTNSVNFDRQYGLHDNSSVTGISNSTTGWTTAQRGNVGNDNFTMITLTYDASQTNSSNAFKLYWNGSELTSQAANSSGTRTSTRADFFRFCENINTTASAGNANIDLDEFKVYTDILTSSEISTLYNGGTITDSSQTHSSSLLTEWNFDEDEQDSAGLYQSTIVGGSRTTHD
jgi:hypothetical protein